LRSPRCAWTLEPRKSSPCQCWGPSSGTGSPLCETHANVIKAIKECSGKTVETKITKGVRLKSGKVRPELLDVDVLVNIPIAKHHVGTLFQRQSQEHDGRPRSRDNAFFHAGSGKTGYEDVDFLSQCIADLNTLRRQDLCVVDATVVLGKQWPCGPRRFAEAAEDRGRHGSGASTRTA